MLQIDSYAYTSRLSKVHPGEKMFFALVTIVICLFSSTLASPLAVFFLMVSLTVLVGGTPWQTYLKILTFPATFILLTAITTGLSFSKSPGEYLWAFELKGLYIGFAKDGLVLSSYLFIKSLAATSSLLFLALTTPMIEVVAMLKRLGLPALITELAALVYRFVFVFLETAGEIYISQASRLGYRNFRTGCVSMGKLAGRLFISAYLRSQGLYTALLARGYAGELKVLEREYRLSSKNIAAMALAAIVIASLNFI